MEEFFRIRAGDLLVPRITLVRQQTDRPIIDQAGSLAPARDRCGRESTSVHTVQRWQAAEHRASSPWKLISYIWFPWQQNLSGTFLTLSPTGRPGRNLGAKRRRMAIWQMATVDRAHFSALPFQSLVRDRKTFSALRAAPEHPCDSWLDHARRERCRPPPLVTGCKPRVPIASRSLSPDIH